MASHWPPKKNVAFTMYFFVYKNDGTLIVNPTLASSAVHVDGNTTEVTDSTLAVVDSTTGLCSIALAQATMNGDQIDGKVVASDSGAVVYTFKLLTATNTQDEIVAGTVKAQVNTVQIEGGDATDALNAATPASVQNIPVDGTLKVDLEHIKTQDVTCGAGVTIRADVGAAAAPGAANGMLIGGSNAATTFASITSTAAFTCGSTALGNTTIGTLGVGAITGTTLALSGAVTAASITLSGTLQAATFVTTGTTTLNALSITGQLDAGNLLVDGTTVLTGAVTAPAGIAANITGDITGSLSGTTGGFAVGTDFTDAQKASVNAEVVDALNVDTYAEPPQEAPGATVSLVAKISYLYKAFRNKFTQDATTASLFNNAGNVVDQKATVSDDGSTFTRGKFGAGP